MRMCIILQICMTASASASASEASTACASWCTRDGFTSSHCSHDDCRGCSGCVDTVACTSTKKDDLKHESCEKWCNSAHAGSHCANCACRRCPFCGVAEPSPPTSTPATSASMPNLQETASPLASPTACSPVASDDGNVQSCKPYCQEKHGASHCPRCDCQTCPFCLRPSDAFSPVSHAVLEHKECTPVDKNDLRYEECSRWCAVAHRGVHCSACACKTCAFCGGAEGGGGAAAAPSASSASAASLAAITAGASKACKPASKDDGKVETCKSYCAEMHAAAHCTRCDCKSCNFCASSAACEPHDKRDSKVASCEIFCNPAHVDSHCPLCRCKTCAFCGGGSLPGGGSAVAPPPTAVAVPCEPFTSKYLGSNGDVSFATCEPFCRAEHAVSHCPLCRCKQCSFCRDHPVVAAGGDPWRFPPPPPDPLCARIGRRGSWADGIIAQVRLKVWEQKSLVRIDWPEAMAAASVVKVDGARLTLASGSSYTFELDDMAKALSVGGEKAVSSWPRRVAYTMIHLQRTRLHPCAQCHGYH